MPSSEAITEGIRIQVESRYVPGRSNPVGGDWFFSYRVRVANEGSVTVQLLSRHWIITDGNGDVQQVKGAGVVGHRPVLAPGEAFEYTSFCPLKTAVGSMEGSYTMAREDGSTFAARIEPFLLSEPHAIN